MLDGAPGRARLTRRAALGVAAGTLVGGATLLGGLASDGDDTAGAADGRFSVRQSGRCIPVTPVSGEAPVGKFYDYRAPFTDPSAPTYSSHGTTHLQRPATSVLFLYDGPAGVSLVAVHGKLHDGTAGGGAVSFTLEGLPRSGEWVVVDDDYDGPSNYDVVDRGGTMARLDWTWRFGRTDGAVFRGMAAADAVTIGPAFNEAAGLYGEHYEGTVTDWQLLTVRDGTVRRASLDMDRPLVVRASGCGSGGNGRETDPPGDGHEGQGDGGAPDEGGEDARGRGRDDDGADGDDRRDSDGEGSDDRGRGDGRGDGDEEEYDEEDEDDEDQEYDEEDEDDDEEDEDEDEFEDDEDDDEEDEDEDDGVGGD